MELDSLSPPRPSGFTLVELLVALSLLSVLVLLAGLLLASARNLALALGEPSAEPPSPLSFLQEDLNRLLRASPEEGGTDLQLDPVEGLRFRRVTPDEAGWIYAEQLHIPPLIDGELLRISRPDVEDATWVTNRLATGLRSWRLSVIAEGEALERWPVEENSGTPLPRRLAAEWETREGETRSGPLFIPAGLRYTPE